MITGKRCLAFDDVVRSSKVVSFPEIPPNLGAIDSACNSSYLFERENANVVNQRRREGEREGASSRRLYIRARKKLLTFSHREPNAKDFDVVCETSVKLCECRHSDVRKR